MSEGVLGTAKREQLEARMAKLGILEADLLEKFVQGSGSGGQKINKTSSCVYLKHIPSGREIKCQKTRSLSLNRYYARVELCEQIEEEVLGEKSKRQQEIEKIRRQKRRRSRKQRAKMLDDKHKHAEKKELRKPVAY